MALFYLSFAESFVDRKTSPEGEGFLGAAIVTAESFVEAVKVAHALGINPGGEVQGHEILGPVCDQDREVPKEFLGVLMDRDELERLSHWAVGL